jgi:hypothetical protein
VAEIRNFTGELERAEAFVRAKCALIATDGLSIHIKHTRAKRRDVTGYYRFADRRIVLAVKRRLRYPRHAAYGVGSVALEQKPVRGRAFKLIWHEDRFASADDLLAFVAGHEIWHFLCHSGQRKGNHETKANCNGFSWLREFRRWTGLAAHVEPVPVLPPRPDVAAATVVAVAAAAPAPRATFIPVVPRPLPFHPSAVAMAQAPRPWLQGELFSESAVVEASGLRPPPSRARRARRRETR